MKRLILIPLIALVLGACTGERVEVPPAHVGKILGTNGYLPDTIPPSKFRLDYCGPRSACDQLVLLQASDTPLEEQFDLFMPKDKLKMSVSVRGTLSIPTTQSVVDNIYNRVNAQGTNLNATSIITSAQVYEIYGKQAVRGVVRSGLVDYTIAEVLGNRDAIAAEIHAAVSAKLAETNTPIKVSRFELSHVSPPDVIVNAQEAAKEREIDIQKAEAQAQIDLVEAERALEVAKADRLVEREKAEAIAEQNRIAAQSITPQLLAYRRLETAERIYSNLAQSNNVVIVPADASSFSNITDDAVLARLLGKEIKR